MILDFTHKHGNITEDGKIEINDTIQSNKNIVTDSNGNIVVEEKEYVTSTEMEDYVDSVIGNLQEDMQS